jgi:uncharacterized protein YcbX
MHSQLADIVIYPVKSLAGIHVSHWPVEKTGLKYDRKWMLVDAAGQFLSQRKLPRMTLVNTALTDHELVLSATGMADLVIPLETLTDEIITSTVWHDQCQAQCVSAEADFWFSRFLNQPCRLVYQPDDSIRCVDPSYAQPEDQTSFSDGFPFLIISENSLVALNRAMTEHIDMIRFRPNLVIAGCPEYAEDEWRQIRIGHIDFRLPKPCSRCSVPTINPNTGTVGKEPLATLNRLRKWQNKVYFGQNALHDQCSLLAVGDAVHVKQSGDKQPPL